MQVNKAVETKHLGELRTSIIFKYFDKAKSLKNKAYPQIASEFFSEMFKHANADSQVENPWASACVTLPQESQTQTQKPEDDNRPSLPVVEYGDDGKAIGIHRSLITKKGFTDHSSIKKKKTGVACHVDYLQNEIEF